MSGQALDQEEAFRQFLRENAPRKGGQSRPKERPREAAARHQRQQPDSRRSEAPDHREDAQPNERDFYDWRRPSEPPQVTRTFPIVPSSSSSRSNAFPLKPAASGRAALPPSRASHAQAQRSHKGKERETSHRGRAEPSHPHRRPHPLPPRPRSSHPFASAESTAPGTIIVRNFRSGAFDMPNFQERLLDLFRPFGQIKDSLFDSLGMSSGQPTVYIQFEDRTACPDALVMHQQPGPGVSKMYVARCSDREDPFASRPPSSAPSPSARRPLPTAPRSDASRAFSPQSSPEKALNRAPDRPVGAWSDSRPAASSSRQQQQPTYESDSTASSSSSGARSTAIRQSDSADDRNAVASTSNATATREAQRSPPPTSSQITEDGDEGAQEDTQEARIPLPDDCRGDSKDAAKKKRAFRIEALKKATKEGKIVLDNRFEGDSLVITYVAVDEADQEPDQPVEMQPPPASRPVRPEPATASNVVDTIARDMAYRETAEDVKPRIPRQPSPDVEMARPREPEETTPQPPPLSFPRKIRGSQAALGIRAACSSFIAEFFTRHQQSRAALEDFYAPSAMFSCRLARGAAQGDPAFNPAFSRIVNKIYITPTPICHALARIPAFSCEPDRFTFDAVELDTLNIRQSTPILLVVHGFVEEFPSHDRLSFTRTFVLLRRTTSHSNAGCPVDLIIQSDQVIFRPFEPECPRPIDDRPQPVPAPPAESSRGISKRAAAEVIDPRRPSKRIVRGDSADVAEQRASRQRSPLFFPSQTPQPEEQPVASTSTSRSGPFSSRRAEQHDFSLPGRAPSRPVAAPAIRDRSRSPVARSGASDDDDEPEDLAALSRRRERQATVAAELNNTGSVSREELDNVVSEAVRRELAAFMALQQRQQQAAATPVPQPPPIAAPVASSSKQRATPSIPAVTAAPPPAIRPRTPPETDSEGGDADVQMIDMTSSSSTHWPIRVGETSAVETRLSGVSNKLRYICRHGKSGVYGMTAGGDILDWSGSPGRPIVTAYKGGQDDRVDDFTITRETLIVGYLGSKVPGEKDLAQPKAQIKLFKVENGQLVGRPLKPRPHLTGGVTSLTTVPGNRTKWVSAGQDKTLYLWTQSSSSKEVRTTNIATTHTNVITSLAYLEGRGNLASAGEDKRVLLYDLSAQQPTWKGMLDSRVLFVSPVPFDNNLVLYRTAASARQFALYDVRKACSAGPVSSFGFARPSRSGSASSSSTASNEVSFGRYFRGDWIDSIFAHPDASTGIKLWDVRQIGTKASGAVPPMASLTCGRSKVLQVLFDDRKGAGEEKLILGEQSFFTSCRLL